MPIDSIVNYIVQLSIDCDCDRTFTIIEDNNPTFSFFVSWRCHISIGSNNRVTVTGIYF